MDLSELDPAPDLAGFTRAEAYEQGAEAGRAFGRREVLEYLVQAGYLTRDQAAQVEWVL